MPKKPSRKTAPHKKKKQLAHRAAPKQQKKHVRQAKAAAASVEFCPKCGSILVPVKSKSGSAYLKCRSCGLEKRKSIRNLRIVEKPRHGKDVAVLEEDKALLPTMEQECPKCTHRKAFWWMQHTRGEDEPPTQFFRCEKCKHVWREYR